MNAKSFEICFKQNPSMWGWIYHGLGREWGRKAGNRGKLGVGFTGKME